MRIRWLLARRVPDVPSPLVVEVCERLRARGHVVDTVLCESATYDVLGGEGARYDLHVLKSHTELALSVAASVEAEGGAVLNPAAACAAAQDKLLATRRLGLAGVPVPRSVVTGEWARIAELAAEAPVLVKPLRGHRGAGVEVVERPEQVAGRPDPAYPLIVQEVVPGPGEDLKVYVVGQRVWAVRKAFSPTSFTRPGRPVPVTDEVAEIALRAGGVSGLGLYGLDLIESPAGPVVVDLNYLPGYKGCADVAAPMAEHVHRAAVDGVGTVSPAAAVRGVA